MIEGNKDKWKYRRIIIYAFSILGLILPFVPTVNPDIYLHVYGLITIIVTTYISAATYEDVNNHRERIKQSLSETENN